MLPESGAQAPDPCDVGRVSGREDIPDSTLADIRDSARSPAVAWARRVAIAALAVVVFLGLAGLLGVYSTTVHATGGGYELELEYPRIARAGQDVPWNLTVRRPGGFAGPLVIALGSDYFDMFESQGRSPEPAAETSDADRNYLTFAPPDGDTFTLGFDASIRSSSQRGATGTVSVVENGTDLVTAEFTTRLVP